MGLKEMKVVFDKIRKEFRSNIIAGTFIILPVFITIFLVATIFLWVDSSLPGILGMSWPPGFGILVLLACAYIAGLIAKNYIGEKVFAAGNLIVKRIPIVNKIYPAVHQIVDSINTQNKKLFDRVVLVEFPKANSYSIAFVTADENPIFSEKLGKKLIAVYMITAPNPTSGFLVYYPEDEVIEIDMAVDVAMKKIMSIGMLHDDQLMKEALHTNVDVHWNKTPIFKREAKTEKIKILDPKD
ncbi:MAG: DUF502 domain-containing protein [Chitinispirillia bacterium]|nr:DUF502 domain-containing protein [Chitinispirillia bacterium]